MFDSISKTSLAAALAVAGVIGLGSGAALLSISNLSNALDESQRTSDLLQAHQSADMMHDALRADAIAAILSRNPAAGLQLSDIEADVREHLAEFKAQIEQETALAKTEAERTALQGVQEPLAAYSAAAENIIALAKSNPDAALAALPAFFQQFYTLEDSMEAVTEAIGASNATAVQEAKHESHLGFWLQLVLLAISLSFALALAVATRRFIAQPLTDIASAMDKLASGDLDIEAPGLQRRDEIGVLGKTLERFRAAAFEAKSMQDTIERERETRDAAQKQAESQARIEAEQLVVSTFGAGLSRLSEGDLTYRLNSDVPPAYEDLRQNFNAAMQHMQKTICVITDCASSVRTGASEITHAANDLSRRTETHAASLEETAAALDELTATVRGAATGAEHANGVAQAALTDAARGAGIVTQAINAMGEIEKSSQQISQIIGVIDEIAFQTNLLALNAGVEAARAGDAGRGFAVVAMEVRSLAQRAAEAAKEIKGLIATSSQQVGQGVDLVGEFGRGANADQRPRHRSKRFDRANRPFRQ